MTEPEINFRTCSNYGRGDQFNDSGSGELFSEGNGFGYGIGFGRGSHVGNGWGDGIIGDVKGGGRGISSIYPATTLRGPYPVFISCLMLHLIFNQRRS